MIRSIILLVYGGLLLLLTFRSLRAMRLKERYVLLFLTIATPFVVLAVWPDGLAKLATATQMPYHTVMILCVTAFIIPVIFEIFSILSVQERRIAHLTQVVGMMQAQIDRLSHDSSESKDLQQNPSPLTPSADTDLSSTTAPGEDANAS